MPREIKRMVKAKEAETVAESKQLLAKMKSRPAKHEIAPPGRTKKKGKVA